jgi:osmoprotectant transport system permease protein
VAPGDPLVRWDWVLGHLDVIAYRLGEHIVFTVVAVAVGFLVSFALAMFITWRPRANGPVLAGAGIVYTIPSIALFALLIPITGLSFLTAEIALVGYTLLILVRNIVTGLGSIPRDVLEAADGAGFTRWQRLWRVELPIALPVIVAGLRVATVTTIGLVAVTAFLGQGGLGRFIIEGHERFFATPLVVGGSLSVVLAFTADALFVRLERLLTPWRQRRGPA